MEKRFSVSMFIISIYMVLILATIAILFAPANMMGFDFTVKAKESEIIEFDNDDDKTNTATSVDFASPISFGNKSAKAANASSKQRYITEMSIASSYNSMKNAIDELESKGFNGYLNQDLNEGAGGGREKGYVVMGYKWSEDPTQAITDVKMMDMNGGFKRMNYQETASKSADSVMRAAQEMQQMCEDYSRKRDQGYISALIAYEGLNKIVNAEKIEDVEEEPDPTKPVKSIKLGDILANNPSLEFLFDIILMGNASILSGIYSYLTMAITDGTWWEQDGEIWYEGEGEDEVDSSGNPLPRATTWMERLAASSGKDFSGSAKELDVKATAILPVLVEYAQSTRAALARYEKSNGKNIEAIKDIDQEDKIGEITTSTSVKDKEEDNDVLFLAVDKMLRSYKYGKTNLADYMLKDGLSSAHFYPLVAAMTQSQYAAVHAGSFLTLASCTYTVDANKDDITDMFYDTMGKLEGTELIPLWYGVNKDPYEGEVGVTQDAYRRMNAQKEYSSLVGEETSEGTALMELVCNWLMLGFTVASLTFMAVGGIASLAGGVCAAIFAKYSVLFIIGCVAAKIALVPLTMIFGIASLVVLVVLLIYYLVASIIESYNENNPTYTSIPRQMYDIKQDTFIKYEAVRSPNGSAPADINNFGGRLWQAMYVTKDPNAGEPLKYYEDVNPFEARYSTSDAPSEESRAISFFGEKRAGNMNRSAFKDEKGGIYVHFNSTESQVVQQQEDGKYISDLKMISLTSEAAVRQQLIDKEYTIIEQNLTAGLKYFTFVGYKTSDDPTNALTDIRICYGNNVSKLMLGSASYGNAGHSGGTKEDAYVTIAAGEYAMYITTDPSAGSPITKIMLSRDRQSPLGYEPVNLASGGSAFDFNTQDFERETSFGTNIFMHFLPSVTYTSGTKYIGGFQIVGNAVTKSTGSSIFSDDYDNHAYIKTLGLIPTIASIKEMLNVVFVGYGGAYTAHKVGICYTETFNPKRAVSNALLLKVPETEYTIPFKSISMHSSGYSVVPHMYNSETPSNGSYAFRSVKANNTYSSGVSAEGGKTYSSAMYVTFNSGEPLKVSDVVFTTSSSYGSFSSIKEVKNLYSNNAEGFYEGTNKAHMFINRPNASKPKYIKNLAVSSTEYDDYAEDIAKVMVVSEGADDIIGYNLNREDDSDKAAHLGLIRQESRENAVTGIAMYYEKNEDKVAGKSVAPSRVTYNGIHYYKSGETGAYVGREHTVFFYITTSSLAGPPVTNVSFGSDVFVNNKDTALIISRRANGFFFLHQEKDYSEGSYVNFVNIANNHTTDTYHNTGTYNYVGEAWTDEEEYAKIALLQNGCSRFIDHDFHENSIGKREYTYIGYSMTNNRNDAITEIRILSANTAVDSKGVYREKSIDYVRVSNSACLNEKSEKGALTIFYTKDTKVHNNGFAATSGISVSSRSQTYKHFYTAGKVELSYEANLYEGIGKKTLYLALSKVADPHKGEVLPNTDGLITGSAISIISSEMLALMCALLVAGGAMAVFIHYKKRKYILSNKKK